MKLMKKAASVALASALVVVGLSAAQPAVADQIAGTITISPTSGNVSDQFFLQSVATSVGAPVGFRAASTSQIFQNGVLVGNISNLRTTSMAVTAGTNGLDGNPALMDRSVIATNNFVSNKQLNNAALSTLTSGTFEYRYYFHASSTSLDLVNDKYLSLTLTYNATTGAWSIPVAATATNTSLTASASGTNVTLAATVTPSGTAGNVVFREGATTVATVVNAAGTVSTTLTGVSNGAHTYTAEFVPTNTAAFTGSTSGTASVTVGSQPAPATVTGDITVQVANGVGGGALVLTASSLTANLGSVVNSGGTLNASGTVTAVVDDSRQVGAAAFSLTGQVSDFTAPGGLVLSSSYLGWTPTVTGVGTGGAVVASSSSATGGLKVARVWATGTPSAADPQPTTTNASALLQLRAPLNTAPGNYSALLTVTLT
ncbi:MAG: hypothetical protein C0444_06760 [Microbacterium sp.]|nr:hypothetical protein [Microbacterium sp.]MBA4345304.1 hypothetical protein [Microbacterium sp.]